VLLIVEREDVEVNAVCRIRQSEAAVVNIDQDR